MTTVDLNADLGESYGPWNMGDDAEMLNTVTSANIACGGHAGDSDTMFDTLSLAASKGVCAGAHPGFEDKQGFGRRRLPLTSTEVQRLIAVQVGAIKGIAALANTHIRYVKTHGALANWGAENADVALSITSAIKQAHPDCAILAISGTELEKAALKQGLETYSEIFADRGYADNGNLIPRSHPQALITDTDIASDRLLRFFETGHMPTVDGNTVELKADSICIHGDNPHAVAMGKRIRQRLVDAGITLAPFISMS